MSYQDHERLERELQDIGQSSRQRVIMAYESVHYFGPRSPKLSADRALSLIRTHGPGRATVYFRGLNGIMHASNQEARVNLATYDIHFNQAYQRFGAEGARFFINGLRWMHNLGKTPEEYFQAVDSAVVEGGKKFGRYFASSLPYAWGSGNEPDQFRQASFEVFQKSGPKAMSTYMWWLPTVTEVVKVSPSEYAQTANGLVDTLGPDIGVRAIRGLTGAFVYGIPLDEFGLNVKDIQDEKGDKAASWYVLGYQGLGELGRNDLEWVGIHQQRVDTFDPRKSFGNPAEALALKKQFLEYTKEALAKFRGLGYREEFLGLSDSIGDGAAFLYARTTGLGARFLHGSPSPREQVTELQRVPDEIRRTQWELNKKDFRTLTFFGFKIPRTIPEAVQYFEDARSIYEVFGPDQLNASLRYSLKANPHTPRAFGIQMPPERKPEEELTD